MHEENYGWVRVIINIKIGLQKGFNSIDQVYKIFIFIRQVCYVMKYNLTFKLTQICWKDTYIYATKQDGGEVEN